MITISISATGPILRTWRSIKTSMGGPVVIDRYRKRERKKPTEMEKQIRESSTVSRVSENHSFVRHGKLVGKVTAKLHGWEINV